ncbi:unnamed protein product [Heligmosomoides polygyrus]|uniref:Dynein regulatory complex subunit 4 n=1 Tax=Heligmosomoides polygyrus TaxID=6339 RepID=A0A183GLE0_HELPZ|nr:unnamed protein product [Heligmosomoides polygyrus]
MAFTLQAKLQQVDVDREKELFDHGKVLAEMQVRYAKEHQTLEAATKETSALTKQITQKDELINQLKSREAQLGCQVAALNIEVKELTEKAYHVPSIQILKDEMANLKVDHARELVDAVVKTKHRTQQEEQDRASSKIAELEEKMMNLLQAVAKTCEISVFQTVSEMEAEMQKQRNRTIDVVAEKERELEAAKHLTLGLLLAFLAAFLRDVATSLIDTNGCVCGKA